MCLQIIHGSLHALAAQGHGWGKNVGEVGPTDPGKDGEVVIEFTTAGTYTFLCGIADHASRGLKGTFTVSA